MPNVAKQTLCCIFLELGFFFVSLKGNSQAVDLRKKMAAYVLYIVVLCFNSGIIILWVILLLLRCIGCELLFYFKRCNL